MLIIIHIFSKGPKIFKIISLNNYFVIKLMLKFKCCSGGRNFSVNVSLPSDTDIEFRYFIAVVCHPNGTKNCAKTLIIRKWETHMTPRIIRKGGE